MYDGVQYPWQLHSSSSNANCCWNGLNTTLLPSRQDSLLSLWLIHLGLCSVTGSLTSRCCEWPCHAYLQIDGDWRYDARKSIMLWSIDIIDAGNRTGSLEFVVPNTRPETFFPVTVNFNATRTLCQVP